MLSLELVVFSILLTVGWSGDLVFPSGFKFGAGSSAYQVEGAWNVSDKSENIFDHSLHKIPWMTADGSNGDVACDSYHLWRQDLDMAEKLGLQFYRFSISWSRLLPNGFANKISEDGKNYYNNLVNGLLERGIEPLVTLFHWDLPQSLQDLGGWANPLISDWFKEYARVVYSLYADRVQTWITINEPITICDYSYSTGVLAPGILNLDAIYECSKNVLLAHAKAWRVYDEEFKPSYHGKVSICNNWVWFEPDSESDKESAELSRQYTTGRYTHPIYSEEGGWPPIIEERLNKYGNEHGYTRPRLPSFTDKEKDLVRGTYDFYAFNHNSSFLARQATPGDEVNSHYMQGIAELNVVMGTNSKWPSTYSSKSYVYPEGIRKHISWVRETYGDFELIISGNGYASSGVMNDFDRMDCIYDYLEQIWLSIFEDGANITAYTYWSLMDSFEWLDTRHKLGLYRVDFNSTLRTRMPRASSDYYKAVIRNHAVHSPRP